MHSSDLTFEPVYRGMPILAGPRLLPCWTAMLDSIHDLFVCARRIHSSSAFLRFDTSLPRCRISRLPDDMADKFRNSLIRNLRESGALPLYAWRREQKPEARHPHWHYVLLLDEGNGPSLDVVLKLAERLWGMAMGDPDAPVVFHNCKRDRSGRSQGNGLRIPWGTDEEGEAFAEAYHWSSYLCKMDEVTMPAKAHGFGSSQVSRYMK